MYIHKATSSWADRGTYMERKNNSMHCGSADMTTAFLRMLKSTISPRDCFSSWRAISCTHT